MRGTTVQFVDDIGHIDCNSWTACFPGEVENYNYHRAVERAGLEGFDLGWYAAHRDGVLVFAVPVFFTTYDMTTTADGGAERVARALQPWVPGQFRVKLSCLGSPVAERCQIGFHACLSRDEVQDVVGTVLEFWAKHAASRRIGLLGLKDVSERDQLTLGSTLERFGFKSVSGLPTASLLVDFRETTEYLARFGASTRKDLRRKLKRREDVQIEFRTDAGPYLEEIAAMYAETRARSDWAFERLSPGYFTEVLGGMDPDALLVLYFHQDELVAANLLLLGENQLLDKFFVMRGDAGRKLNLYFVSWLQNIELCLEMGLSSYVSGQGAAETKIRLGSTLGCNRIYFKHQNPILSKALGAISGLLEIKQPTSIAAGRNVASAPGAGTHYFLWLIFVILETAAQLTLKMASSAVTTHYMQSIGPIVNSPWFMASIACDAANLIIWLAILRRYELSVAVPLTSMTYFAVLLASALLLHEPVRIAQSMGLILIGVGVTMVSWNERLQDDGG